MKPAAENTPPVRLSPGRSGGVTQVLIENQARFLRFLTQRVGDRHTAEEILQAALVRSLDRGETLRDNESVMAWFYRVLRNALVDHHRKSAAERRALHGAAAEAVSVVDPDDALKAQSCACVVGMLDSLKPEYAQALRRVEMDGIGVPAFAAEAGISPNNAGVRLHRARQALRSHLTQLCGSCAHDDCQDCTC